MNNVLISSRLRLRHIRCFIAIAQERHLGRAAENLGLTQPAVSKTLLELEAILATTLVSRGRLGAQLTRDGEHFLSYALGILEALDAAVDAVKPQADVKDTHIRIGALPTVAPALLPAALDAFWKVRPTAKVTVEVAANVPLLESLQAGRLDFIIGRMSDPQAMVGMSFDLLYVEPLILAVCADHPLVAQAVPSLSDILSYPLVVSTPGTVPRHRTDSFLASHGARLVNGYVETLSVSLARLLVLKNHSVWFVPKGAVREDLALGDMVALPIDTKGTEEPVGFVRRSQQDVSPVVLELLQHIRATV